jgi:FMN phosphatase YigB (HAD superfamily)
LGVKPDEAVFVDDTRQHVEAAQELGLQGILFTTAEKLEEEIDLLLRKNP